MPLPDSCTACMLISCHASASGNASRCEWRVQNHSQTVCYPFVCRQHLLWGHPQDLEHLQDSGSSLRPVSRSSMPMLCGPITISINWLNAVAAHNLLLLAEYIGLPAYIAAAMISSGRWLFINFRTSPVGQSQYTVDTFALSISCHGLGFCYSSELSAVNDVELRHVFGDCSLQCSVRNQPQGSGPSSSPAPFAFGQQPSGAAAPAFGQAAPAFGQAPTAAAPAFGWSFPVSPQWLCSRHQQCCTCCKEEGHLRRRK